METGSPLMPRTHFASHWVSWGHTRPQTAGSDEVRAWTFKAGSKAPQCAGVIHSDFERGFIRAEVIKYEDYIALGGESACRQAGKLGIEGKEYIVQDGDIMHFLFNV